MLKLENEVHDSLILLSEKLSVASALGELSDVNTEMRAAFLHAFTFKNSPSHTMATMDFLNDIWRFVNSHRMRSSVESFARLTALLKLIEDAQVKLYAYVDQFRANYLAAKTAEQNEN